MKYVNTVLIVDDDPGVRDTLKALLEREDYQLCFAHDGQDALEKAQAIIPSVILLDVMMPEMDGFEVCQRLRTMPLLAEVPIIILTACDDRSSRLQGIQAGADDFLSKPFDREELRARIRTILRLNRYRRLHQERAKFEWVVQHARDGYLIINDQDEILYANSYARHFLGMVSEECAYETLSDFWIWLGNNICLNRKMSGNSGLIKAYLPIVSPLYGQTRIATFRSFLASGGCVGNSFRIRNGKSVAIIGCHFPN